jgi:acyl-CoA thioester hydrolase
VYYANYLNWLEAGRTEILRDNGISYKDYEKKGFFAPVVKVEVEYKSSARYDDIVVVETTVSKIGNSSVEFNYKIYRKEDNLLLVEAKTVNVFVKKNGEKISVPDEIRKIIRD